MHGGILIADGNPRVRELACESLAPLGFSVAQAADALQTLRLARSFRPALILIDVRLSGLADLDLIHELRNRPSTERAVLVACSTDCGPASRELRPVGFDGLLPRPLGLDDFRRLVARFLNRGKKRSAAAILTASATSAFSVLRPRTGSSVPQPLRGPVQARLNPTLPPAA